MRRADASEWRNVCGNKNDLSSRKKESVKEREREIVNERRRKRETKEKKTEDYQRRSYSADYIRT